MIAQERHLLATNSKPFTRSLTAPSERLEQIPVPIREALDPWRCPQQLLGWLAHTLSLDIWIEDWSESRKRAAIADAIRLNRIKGTRAGLDAYVDLADGEVLAVDLPPAGIYPDEGPDEAALARWRAAFAQIRIHDRPLDAGPADNACAGSIFPHDEPEPKGGCYPIEYAPVPTRTMVLWDDGEETVFNARKTTVATFGSTAIVEEWWADGAHPGIYLDQSHVDAHLAEERPVRRFVSRREVDYDHPVFSPLAISFAADVPLVDERPEHVRETFETDGVFAGSCHLDGGYLHPDDGWRHVYQMWRIYEPERSLGLEAPNGYHIGGRARLSLPPYEAHIAIEHAAPAGESHLFAGGFVDQVLGQEDTLKRNQLLDACALSKAERDQFLIRTAFHRPVTFGDRLTVADMAFGKLIKEV